jgi:hypothetical protein
VSGAGRAAAGRVRGALFPGDRRVWLVAAAVLALCAIGIGVALLQPREYFTGTNSVAAREGVVQVPAGQRLCVRRLRLPAGTGAVRFGVDSQQHPRPALELEGRTTDGDVFRGRLAGSARTGLQKVDIAIPTRPASPGYELATLCLKPVGGYVYAAGRSTLQSNDLPPTVGGKQVLSRIAVWFLPPNHEKRSLLSHMGEMFRRAALFRPSFVGAWTYWLLLVGVLPLTGYFGLRLIAAADAGRRRVPLAVWVGAIAFVMAASWAFVTPAFQSPDEPEHFAYVQYFGETGKAIDKVQTSRPPYSVAEGTALEAVRMSSVIERAEAKPPWLPSEEGTWRARVAKFHPQRDNGGGFHPATSVHSPAYYALEAPAYLATRDASVFSQLTAMRLTSALMGALTAALAALTMLALLPGRRALAAAAGLFVAFEPMFGFISGAVNNDNGVNLAAAAIVFLVVRSLRRGLTYPAAVAIGAALVAAPVLKATGYELYPPAILALLVLLAVRRDRQTLLALGVVALSFVVLEVGWSQLATEFHRSTFTTPGGTSPVKNLPAYTNVRAFLSWLWQVLIPIRLPFMTNYTIINWPFFNIYIERGFAGFGWYAIFFPIWVYVVILLAGTGLAAIGVRLAFVARRSLREYSPALGFLLLVPVVVVVAVEAAYFTVFDLPIDGTAEQGRYAFTAITAVAVLAASACVGLGRRRAVPVAAGLVAALIGLTAASQLLTLATFYT